MGGGTLNLKVLRGEEGAQAVLEIWVRSGGGGGQKSCLSVGGGMDFCWNNPLSQTVLQEEMINQHNIILLQISTGYGYVSFWLSCNSSGSVPLPLAGTTIIHIGSLLGVSVL